MSRAFSDYMRDFYGLDYLYNVLPYDIVGDTIGVICGSRQELRSLRELFKQRTNEPVWLRLIPDHVPNRAIAAEALRRVVLDRLAVSRSRSGEPITLLPLGPGLVGATGDKPVDNAYRGVGTFVSRVLTDETRAVLARHVRAWSDHPLARLTGVVIRHAQAEVGGVLRVTAVTSPPRPLAPEDFPWLSVLRHDLGALLDSWDEHGFGPEQQLDQLRTLLCFHLARHVFFCAARRLVHRGEERGAEPMFLCDAARMIGSPMARPAYHCLNFWLARVREAGTEIAWWRACGLQEERGPAWDGRFGEIEREGDIAIRIARVIEWLEGPAFSSEGRRPTPAVIKDFREEARRQFAKVYSPGVVSEPLGSGDQARLLALARSLAGVYSGKSRLLAKVRDFIGAAGDGGGWIGPKGTHQRKRFLFREDLLEVLTLVHHRRVLRGEVHQPDPTTVEGMIDEWAARYALVIDSSRPAILESLERGRVDERLRAHLPPSGVAADNMRELEDRLVELRLARRYSDASVALDSTGFPGLRRTVGATRGTAPV